MKNKTIAVILIAFAAVAALSEVSDAAMRKAARPHRVFAAARVHRQDVGETLYVAPIQAPCGFVWRRFQWVPVPAMNNVSTCSPCAPAICEATNDEVAPVEEPVNAEEVVAPVEEPVKVEEVTEPVVEPVKVEETEEAENTAVTPVVEPADVEVEDVEEIAEPVKVESEELEPADEPVKTVVEFDEPLENVEEDAESAEEVVKIEDVVEPVDEEDAGEVAEPADVDGDEELSAKIIGVWTREETVAGMTSKTTATYSEDGTVESVIEIPNLNQTMKSVSEYEISDGVLTFKADEFSNMPDTQAKIEFTSDDEMQLSVVISKEMSEMLKNAQQLVAEAQENGALDEIDSPANLKGLSGNMEKMVAEPKVWTRVK